MVMIIFKKNNNDNDSIKNKSSNIQIKFTGYNEKFKRRVVRETDRA